MKNIPKRTVSLLLITLLFACTVISFRITSGAEEATAPSEQASPPAPTSQNVVTIGVDLSEEQRNFMTEYFGADLNTCRVIYVNNQQEREYLGSWVPLEEIDNVTTSCAYVQPTQSGGIQVKTANLTYVTGNMIASVLSTAGVTNCNVVAAAPFPVSGTGALTGIMIAYENATEETLDQDKRDLSVMEFTVTRQLGTSLGDEEALQLVNAVKLEVIRSKDSGSEEGTEAIVDRVIANMDQDPSGTTIRERLSAEDLQLLTDLADQIAAQDYAYDEVRETLERVDENLSAQTNRDAGIAEDDIWAVPEDVWALPDDTQDSILANTNDELIDPALQSDTGLETYTTCYEAYLAFLQQREYAITAYNYQLDLHGETPSNATALCDIYGDETPELLYIALEPTDGVDETFWPAYLHIVTWENASLREIYAGPIDKGRAAGGVSYYYLFQVAGEKNLYEYTSAGDEGGTRQYCRYPVSGDMAAGKESLCSVTMDWSGAVTQCTLNGQPSDESACSAMIQDLQARTVLIVFYNQNCSLFVAEYVLNNGCQGSTYADMINFLYNMTLITPGTPQLFTYEEPAAEPVEDVWALPDTVAEEPSPGNGFSSWQDAYSDFILNGRYMSDPDINTGQGLSEGVEFALWDISDQFFGGDTPELLVNNNADGMVSMMTIVYTFDPVTGQVVRLGNTEAHSVAHAAGISPQANGIFAANFGSLKYYYSGEGEGFYSDQVSMEDVFSPENTEISITEPFLRDIYENDTVTLTYYHLADINNMGWDAFISQWYNLQWGDHKAATMPVQITEIDEFNLSNFLAKFMWLSDTYDCTSVTSSSEWRSILEGVIAHPSCCDEAYYPGELAEESWDGADPLGKWTSYRKFSEAKAYWILTNIFNVTDADYHTLQEQMFANTDTYLYDDGYYYSFLGGVGGGYQATIEDIQQENGDYIVQFSVDDDYFSMHKELTARLQFKNIDGRYYWSLYQMTAR